MSAIVSANLSLPGIEVLSIENGTISFAFGLGIEEASERIYFPEISSSLMALRQKASWQKVGGMDISLPVNIALPLAGGSLNIKPILSISDKNLFDTVNATVSLDFEIL